MAKRRRRTTQKQRVAARRNLVLARQKRNRRIKKAAKVGLGVGLFAGAVYASNTKIGSKYASTMIAGGRKVHSVFGSKNTGSGPVSIPVAKAASIGTPATIKKPKWTRPGGFQKNNYFRDIGKEFKTGRSKRAHELRSPGKYRYMGLGKDLPFRMKEASMMHPKHWEQKNKYRRSTLNRQKALERARKRRG